MQLPVSVPEIREKTSVLQVVVALTVLTLAIWIRLHNLDARGVHFDEGVHGYYSWEFLRSGEFTYEPWRHGPLLYYVSVVSMKILGESITTGRTAVAVLSLGIFPALYLLRDELPRQALGFSALVLALHPYVVLTARFYRNDVLLATFSLLLVGCYARWYRTGNWVWAASLGMITGFAFASKEAAFLILPAITAAILVVLHFYARFDTGSIRDAFSQFLPPRHLSLILLGFLSVIVFFYGGWPLEPKNSFTEFGDGLTYWLSEGQEEEGTITYYLNWIVSGTPVLFLLGVIGSLGTVLRVHSEWFRWIFFAWAGFVTLLLSLIGDQSWWLVVLLFPPIVLLAGYGVADLLIGMTILRDAVDERTNIFRRSRLGLPAAGYLAGRIFGAVVLPVGLAVLVLAVVTGAVATPDTIAGLEHPNRTTTLGIEGVTVPDQPDTRDEALQAAREVVIETECPGIIGPNVHEWPAKWWFRGLEHSRETDLKEEHLPAVVVTGNEFHYLEKRGYQVMEFGKHRVYVPPTDCANADT